MHTLANGESMPAASTGESRSSARQPLEGTRESSLHPNQHEQLHCPPQVDFGKDESAGSPEVLDEFGIQRILIVDDEADLRTICRHALKSDVVECDEASDGVLGLQAAQARPYDLVLLDVDMPNMKGPEVCRQLRATPPCPHLKVIMLSGRVSPNDLAQMMMTGADDYLQKPFTIIQLRARAQAALRLKKAQDRSDLLNRNLMAVNAALERTLTIRNSDLVQARNALVLGLAKLVEWRDTETGEHLMRLQCYSRCLAEEAAKSHSFASQIDSHFIDMLECCTPLHDIGKVALPDHVLLKPGKLTSEERRVMRTHPVIGATTLERVAQQQGFAVAFLRMAIDITRHHHERYDGTGYPDRLRGSEIPLAARLVAICDVYDALRSRRVYKPAWPHEEAVQAITEESPGHFDPVLLQVFRGCAHQFKRIFDDLVD
jgi:response regulator RpfG family c-di-GMP phosphodiesterase